VVLLVEDQSLKEINVGESYQISAGAIGDAKAGPSGAKVLACCVVEKGKPLVTPTP
jgi:hypothetical protein